MLSRNASIFLDILRIVSAELVVIGHLSFFVENTTGRPALAFLGNIGVFFFFILSGMLISASVFRRSQDPTYTFKHFFIDRFSRIYSGLIPCLGIILVVNLIHVGLNQDHFTFFFGKRESLTIWNFISNLFMLQGKQSMFGIGYNYFGDSFPLFTLAIEWWLYVSFGWYVLRHKKKKSLFDLRFFLPLFVFLVIPFFRLFVSNESLVFTWYLGVLATLMLLKKQEALSRYIWIFYIAITLAVLQLLYDLNLYFGETPFGFYQDYLLPIWFTCLVLFIVFFLNKKQENVFHPKLASLGKCMAGYSYTLYILHFSVISIVFLFASQLPVWKAAVLAFGVVNGISALVAYYTEMRYKQIAIYLKRITA